MAKNRDERYASTEDMLEDLRLMRAGEQPRHAKRVANLDTLAQLEEKGKTVDLAPAVAAKPSMWSQPIVIIMMCVIAMLAFAEIITIGVAISISK
jgi:hypothetical protein